MTTIRIRFDGSEYRVPGKALPGSKREESQSYYTDDKQDAIGTAKLMHGENITVRIIRVEEI